MSHVIAAVKNKHYDFWLMNTEIPHDFSFSKAEKLCGKKAFDALFKHPFHFKKGVLKFFFVYPFPSELVNAPVSFAFAVPKKIFKRANKRNLLKRRMREGVRLNKHLLTTIFAQKEEKIAIFIKYESSQIVDSAQIHALIVQAFEKIVKQIKS